LAAIAVKNPQRIQCFIYRLPVAKIDAFQASSLLNNLKDH